MRLREDQILALSGTMSVHAKEGVFAALRVSGRASHLDDGTLRAEIQRLFLIAEAAGFQTPHQRARLVELVFLLGDDAKRSPLCADVIRGVLAAVTVPDVVRMDFLFRHVLSRPSWPGG